MVKGDWRRVRGEGRAVKDVQSLATDERTIRVLSLALAAFEEWKNSGELPNVPGMTEQDWSLAERLLEGAS